MEEWPIPLQVVGRALRSWWDDWVNMAVVNMLWWLAWLTIVLGPPATFGVYYVANQLAHSQSVGLGGLLTGGRRYFAMSWRWFLLNVVVTAVIGANLLFYRSFDAVWADLMRAFFWLLAAAWLIVQFYALPYAIEQEEKRVRVALRNGLFTALAAPGYTAVIIIVALLILVISAGLFALLFIGGLCLIAVLGNHAVLERLETFGVREPRRSLEEEV
jgi:uncharacterized membrane protein YesL